MRGRGWLAAVAGFAATAVVLTTVAVTGARSASLSPAATWVAASAQPPVTSPATTASASPVPTPTAAATATPGPSVDCAVWGCPLAQRLKAAESRVKAAPGRLGAIVRDRETGAVWRAGSSSHVMWASSTVKLAMVTSILERGRSGEVTVDAAARSQISAILSTSDDASADALWKRYGADAMVARFQTGYGMSGLTFVSGFQRTWGFMKCSAEDLQRLMTYILQTLDTTDRATLMSGMRSVGDIQRWGVWAAGSAQQPGVKNGWSIESDAGTKHWCTSTVGFAGPNARYVVAMMDDVPAGSTIDAGVHAVSDTVATIFGAAVPAQVTVPDPSTGL